MNEYLKTLILRPVKSSQTKNVSAYAIIKPNAKGNEITLAITNLNSDNKHHLVMQCEDKSVFSLEINGLKKEQLLHLPDDIKSPIKAFVVLSANGRTFSPLFFGEYQGNKTNLSEILKLYEKNLKKTKIIETEKKSHIDDLPTSKQTENRGVAQPNSEDERLPTPTDCSNEQNLTNTQNKPVLNKNDYGVNTNLNSESIEYNDEAIAQENYFELYNKENNENLPNQTNDFNDGDKQTPKKEEISARASGYENSPCNNTSESQHSDKSKSNNCERLPTFYQSVKERIDLLFEKYPPFTPLNELISKGKWVKIPYSNDKYYVVGVVFAGSIPEYLVYGVPGYKNQKPQGFERYSAFIPESVCSVDESGFWCILQSAETGEQIISSD
ncbi:MAG: hypothetical protein IKJ19_02750 [Clostridia bacterium]|nr:hypothetical protein [Clostridia bacterium]